MAVTAAHHGNAQVSHLDRQQLQLVRAEMGNQQDDLRTFRPHLRHHFAQGALVADEFEIHQVGRVGYLGGVGGAQAGDAHLPPGDIQDGVRLDAQIDRHAAIRCAGAGWR